MPSAGPARVFAIVLLFVEGLSGASVGVTLMSGLVTLGGAATAISVGMFVYGVALVGGAIGLVLAREWGWWLAVGLIIAGLGLLLVLMITLAGSDVVLLGGVVIWAITLGALVASRPGSRR